MTLSAGTCRSSRSSPPCRIANPPRYSVPAPSTNPRSKAPSKPSRISFASSMEASLLSLQHSLPFQLTRLHSTVPKVIFHCALSQVRGPKAARIYAEARAASFPSSSPSPSTALPPPPPTAAEAASAFAPNPFAPAPPPTTPAPAAEETEGAGGPPKEQEVLVLRDGFEGWQSLYRVRCSLHASPLSSSSSLDSPSL